MKRKTKIVCTLGPATSTELQITGLVQAGMDVARINFSHGSREIQEALIARVRRTADEMQIPIPILADLQGPRIRLGVVAEGTVLRKGQDFILTASEIHGDAQMASISYPPLPLEIQPGARVLINDGLLSLQVLSVVDDKIYCRVLEGGPLGSRKGVNLPDTALSVPSLAAKDRDDLAFALQQGVDFIALSFVRHASDLSLLREAMVAIGIVAPIIAKIERPEAVKEIDNIVAACDGIMIARGDLGVEISSEEVPLIQKMIIRKALAAAKPVITATQMLESMITNLRPTRAEASDVANAVLDGTSAVMLSGETSVGSYPCQAVETMQRIILAVESRGLPIFPFREHPGGSAESPADAVSHAACLMAQELSAKAIVTVTHTGQTARRLASHRPQLPILGVTDNPKVVRLLNLEWGVRGICVPEISDTDTTLDSIEKLLRLEHWLEPGDRVIYVAGMPLLMRGSTNMLKVSVVA
jgi:pyruvate kinase